MTQKTLALGVAMLVLIATVAFGISSVFAQQTPSSGSISEDDNSINTSNTATKVKDSVNCNISGFRNSCDTDSSSTIDSSSEYDIDSSISDDIPSVPPSG